MRGPFDDAIEAQQEPPLTGAAVAAEEQRRRPPGGKQLLRLLQLLETAGYTEPAEAAVEAAVSEENRRSSERTPRNLRRLRPAWHRGGRAAPPTPAGAGRRGR